jgi:hypothetical protein
LNLVGRFFAVLNDFLFYLIGFSSRGLLFFLIVSACVKGFGIISRYWRRGDIAGCFVDCDRMLA